MSFLITRRPHMGYFSLVLFLLAVAFAIMFFQVKFPLVGVDDASIFFVYGKNLTEGKGLVYNAGGERVEGFTSLLWMLIVAIGYLLFSNPEKFLLAISLLMIALAVTVLLFKLEGRPKIGIKGVVLLAWILSSPAFMVWTGLSLMDTALWTALLVTGSAIAVFGGSLPFLSIITIFILLARPEGMFWALFLIILASLPVLLEKGPVAALKKFRFPLSIYFLTLTALIVWRLLYFGYPLPNTYYAKVSPDIAYNLSQGIRYLVAFLYINPVVLIGVIPAIAALLLNLPWFLKSALHPTPNIGQDKRIQLIQVSLLVLVGLLMPVYFGGDHFENFRFYQPVWPLLILPALMLVELFQFQTPRPMVTITAIGFIAIAFWLPRVNWFNQAYREGLILELKVTKDGRANAQIMNDLFADHLPSVGVVGAGAIALDYDGFVVDLMGLNNTAMAHAPGDRKGRKNHAAFNASMFFAQHPDILLPVTIYPGSNFRDYQYDLSFYNYFLNGLLQDPVFLEEYKLVTMSDGPNTIVAYSDREFISKANEQGLFVEAVEGLKISDR